LIRQKEFEELIKNEGKILFNTIFCILGDTHDTEDVYQESLLSAYSSLPSFKGDSKLFTWVYSITMNVVNNHLRKKVRQRKWIKSDSAEIKNERDGNKTEYGSDLIGKIMEEKELSIALQTALMDLPPEYRIVVVMREIDRMSYVDISRMLGIKIGTVESRLFRARSILRKRLERAFGENR